MRILFNDRLLCRAQTRGVQTPIGAARENFNGCLQVRRMSRIRSRNQPPAAPAFKRGAAAPIGFPGSS
jgi:hypothetical protein